tara:strand:- start:52 stop:222 length:171 start_codon:yes stop_codon:yes gene_type:complete
MTVNKMPLEVVVNNLQHSDTQVEELEEQFFEKLEKFNEDVRKLNETIERLKGKYNG